MIELYVPEDGLLYDEASIIRTASGRAYDSALVAVDMSARRTYGVFDAAGNLVPETGPDNKPAPAEKSRQTSKYYEGDFVYCGRARFFHFGHFLVEGLDRVWPLLDNKYKNAKLVFIVKPRENLPEYVTEFLRLFGVGPERLILLKETARFEHLYVPQRASRIAGYTSQVQNQVYQQIAKNARADKKYGEKIYMSRARLAKGAIFGEEKIQRIFERNGYHIIYPEELSIEQQVAVAAGAREIAGLAGSALHLSVFMQPGGRVVQLNRALHRDNAFTQYVLCCGAGVDMTLISASVETVAARHSASHPHIVGVTPFLQKYFDDKGFKYNAADLARDDAAFAAYEAALRDYHRRRGVRYKVTRFLIKLVACFVPGYQNRYAVRKWLEDKVGLGK